MVAVFLIVFLGSLFLGADFLAAGFLRHENGRLVPRE